MYSKRKSPNTKKYWLVAAVVFVIAAVGAGLELSGTTNVFGNASEEPESQLPGLNEINYGPPTEEEQAAGDKRKEEIVAQEQAPQPLPEGATVAIVDASQYEDEVEVRSFVSNIVSDGECTITFEQDTQSITKTVNAFAEASTTLCLSLVVPRSEFPSTGEWTVTVTYKNDTIMGSASRTLVLE